MRHEWVLTGQEIDKTLDLCYIRVAGLHRECKPAVFFDPPNFRPRTMTHTYVQYKSYETEHFIWYETDSRRGQNVRPMAFISVRTAVAPVYVHTYLHTYILISIWEFYKPQMCTLRMLVICTDVNLTEEMLTKCAYLKCQ